MYSIIFNIDVEYTDGDSASDIATNEENARDFLDECVEESKETENPVCYYCITKTETSGGMIVSEETIEEKSL